MAYTTIDDPTLYFSTTLYTGNAADDRAVTIDGTGMQPDMVWNKSRSLGEAHVLGDSVRGVQRKIVPNDTDAQSSSSSFTNFSTITSTGFTVSKGGVDGAVNQNGATYCNWAWKAGTAVSGNSTGSGTAKAYSGSVNTDAGFSIIKYIGNGTSAHTIPHHLGAVPQWVIIKELSNASDWMGYHVGKGNTHTLKLNEPEAGVDRTDWWNDTTPTSSVVTLGDNGEINQNDTNYIMYAFSEKQGYSKFAKYSGNGNADGTFIYLGFKPAFFIFKELAAEAWIIKDNKTETFNPNLTHNRSDSNDAENADGWSGMDFLSNGIKLRTSDGSMNESGAAYIYMAFAENPFVSSTGVAGTAK